LPVHSLVLYSFGMDDELRNLLVENNQLLKEQLELTRESHTRIQRMYGILRRGFYAKIAYWIILILITAGVFYTLVPRIEHLIEMYKSVVAPVVSMQNNLETLNPSSIQGLTDIADIEKLQDFLGIKIGQ